MNYKTYLIKEQYKSVYYFLKNNGFSENYIKNLRKKMGYIKINGCNSNIKNSLNKNDILEIESSPNLKTSIMHCIIPLDVVYEDEDYLLIYKDSGISCMPTKSHYNSNISGAICYYMNQKDNNFVLRVINRLDKDTAGFIMIAKNSIAQKELKIFNKTYTAVCEGIIKRKKIISKKIETIKINGINQLKRIISPTGKDATTFVTPLSVNLEKNLSLLKIEIDHGRTHQIRLHMSYIGNPLLGDEIYGTKSNYLSHTALYCNKVSFYHPFKNIYLEFEHSYENDFLEILKFF